MHRRVRPQPAAIKGFRVRLVRWIVKGPACRTNPVNLRDPPLSALQLLLPWDAVHRHKDGPGGPDIRSQLPAQTPAEEIGILRNRIRSLELKQLPSPPVPSPMAAKFAPFNTTE